MRRLIATLLVLLLAGSPWSSGKLRCEGSSTLEGVSAEIQSIETKTNKNGSTVFNSSVRITNGSDKAVMKVRYDISILDKAGNELHTFPLSYLNVESAVEPGESVFDKRGYQQVIEGKPYKAVITVVSLSGEDEIPPVHLPQKGEYLYQCLNSDSLSKIDSEPPASVFIRIDRGGSEAVADLRSEAEIKEAVELFAEITIAAETQEFVTDNYNAVTFTFNDGSSKTVSFNLKNLEVGYYNETHIYELEDFSAFWSFAQRVVKEN